MSVKLSDWDRGNIEELFPDLDAEFVVRGNTPLAEAYMASSLAHRGLVHRTKKGRNNPVEPSYYTLKQELKDFLRSEEARKQALHDDALF